jgi:LPS sulfotransferase NodH
VRWVVEPLPIPADPPVATRSLVICATPRSGSWLLADLLEQSGVAGRPHEWFWRATVAAHTAAWGTTTRDEYLRAVLAVGTTPNGVFGAKVMWTAFDEAIVAQLPAPRFVRLRRDDEVAQAVSFWKAVATGRWHTWDGPAGAAEYRRDAIEHLLGELRAQNDAWSRWFGANGVEPLDVRYERLAAEPDAEARRVLAFLGVEAPAARLEPRVRPVRDSVNADWEARFRAVP